MRNRPHVRSAALGGYARLAAGLGLDPLTLARTVGLKPATLASPDMAIAAYKVYRLLELTASISGVQDIGLRLASERARLSYLGALGALVRDEPDVRSAVRRLSCGMPLHSTCLSIDVSEARGVVVIQLDLLPDGEPVLRQSTECAVGGLFFTLRRLIGPGWKPSSIQFLHRCAASDRPHRALFGCPVRFGEEANALVLDSHEFDQAIPMSDSGLRAYAPVSSAELMPRRGAVAAERVGQSLRRLLPTGGCSAEAIARELGITRRTLHRQLAQGALTFAGLLHQVRLELAHQYLAGQSLAMTEIAELLGFQSASAFSRWFSARNGTPPSRWQAGAMAGDDQKIL